MTTRLWSKTSLLVVLALALLATPRPALPADDGGGRSVFADGAGNRPLGLGGAYAGLADDASAVLWNPGGLGFVQRYELQATHTNLIGFGFSEQYASLALPSWKIGVFSLTYRHFGVDGIEGRDDRNALISDSLTDKETELTLAYGYQLGTAWSVGCGFKLRGHKLAGASDTGLGLDLGVMVRPLVAAGSTLPWAEDLSFGLAVRNLAEPGIQLDQDVVPDPRGIRAGLAYTHRLGRQSALIGVLDLEKTRDMDSRVHAGLEAQIVPQLTLRLGADDGTFVAGAGIRWQDYGIDYAFENLTPTNIHRIGLSIRFGATREMRRLAALHREEEDLRLRLDAALADKSRRRSAELVRQTETALRENDLEQAASALAMLQVIDPDNAEIAQLETSLLIAQARELEAEGDFTGAEVALGRALSLEPSDAVAAAMLERVRTANDRAAARTAEIRGRLDRAMDAFAAGRLLEARYGFASVLADSPADADATTMLRRTDEAIERRTAELLDQARLLTVAGEFAEADSTLGEARRLAPDSREVAALASFLADEKLARSLAELVPASADAPSTEQETLVGLAGATLAPAGTEAPALSARKKQELADLYRRGMEAVERDEVNEAIHYWEIVWETDPEYQQVSEYLKQQYLSRGMEAFVAGQLEEAIASWENAVRVDPADERARGYLARANEQLSRMQQLERGTR